MAVWYIIFNLQKVSVMMENPCIVDNVEAVEGALNDSFDNLDSKPAFRYGYEYALWWNWGKRKTIFGNLQTEAGHKKRSCNILVDKSNWRKVPKEWEKQKHQPPFPCSPLAEDTVGV